MPRELNYYTLEELCNENKKIIIKSQDGIEIGIEPSKGGTIINLYLGGKIKKLDSFSNYIIKIDKTH